MTSKLTRRALFSLDRFQPKRPSRGASEDTDSSVGTFSLEHFYAARSPSDSSRLAVFSVKVSEPIPTSARGVPDLPRRGRS